MMLSLKLDTTLSDPRIAALLQAHLDDMRAQSPPESVHALDLQRLRQPEIRFWTAWSGEQLLGCGAWKRLDAGHGELKSMRTDAACRGRGVARAVLRQLIDDAQAAGIRRLSLETGSQDFFMPALALYRAHGFETCGPFGAYLEDPNSVFMTRLL